MRTITDEELLQLPKDGNKYEVVDGELVATPVDFRHELVIPHVAAALGAFVHEHRLGDLIGSNALYVFPNGNKRGPDLSFVAAGRLDAPGVSQVFPELSPDLAVEVLTRWDCIGAWPTMSVKRSARTARSTAKTCCPASAARSQNCSTEAAVKRVGARPAKRRK